MGHRMPGHCLCFATRHQHLRHNHDFLQHFRRGMNYSLSALDNIYTLVYMFMYPQEYLPLHSLVFICPLTSSLLSSRTGWLWCDFRYHPLCQPQKHRCGLWCGWCWWKHWCGDVGCVVLVACRCLWFHQTSFR